MSATVAGRFAPLPSWFKTSNFWFLCVIFLNFQKQLHHLPLKYEKPRRGAEKRVFTSTPQEAKERLLVFCFLFFKRSRFLLGKKKNKTCSMHSSWPGCRPHRWDLKCSAEHGVKVRGDEQEYQVFNWFCSLWDAQRIRSQLLTQIQLNQSQSTWTSHENFSDEGRSYRELFQIPFYFPQILGFFFSFKFIGILFCLFLFTRTLPLESVCSTVVSLFFHNSLRPQVVFEHITLPIDVMLTELAANLLESDRGCLETARLYILGFVVFFLQTSQAAASTCSNCLGRSRGSLITINSTIFHV